MGHVDNAVVTSAEGQCVFFFRFSLHIASAAAEGLFVLLVA